MYTSSEYSFKNYYIVNKESYIALVQFYNLKFDLKVLNIQFENGEKVGRISLKSNLMS